MSTQPLAPAATKPAESPPQVGAREAHLRFGELVQRAQYGDERVIITRHGRPAAMLIGISDFERLTAGRAA